jgi:hypothetical protein
MVQSMFLISSKWLARGDHASKYCVNLIQKGPATAGPFFIGKGVLDPLQYVDEEENPYWYPCVQRSEIY